MMHRRFVVGGLPLLAAACGGILPKPAPPPVLYRLTPLADAEPPGPPLDLALAVQVPEADDSLDTARIALTRGEFGFDYFANAAWTDRAPVMVQVLMIESLEHRFRVVAGNVAEIRPDAVLASTLRRFEAAYGGERAPTAAVRLDCLLLRPADHAVLGVRSFAGSSRAAANDVAAIVAAFDTALHGAIREMPGWIAASLGARR